MDLNGKSIIGAFLLILITIPSCKSTDSPIITENANSAGLLERPANDSCKARNQNILNPGLIVEKAFPDLSFNRPVLIKMDPEGTSFFILEQAGAIFKVDVTQDLVTKTLVSDIKDQVISYTLNEINPNIYSIELGLLGLAFHPNFENNNEVFLIYTSPSPGEDYLNCGEVLPFDCNAVWTLSRFNYLPSQGQIDPASEEIILEVDFENTAHFGGSLEFGPDGYLYASIGDGNLPKDVSPAQDPFDLRGSLIRIDVDGGSPYAIPPDNPFAVSGGAPEIFAMGFRNPWKWSMDKITGDIWLGDVGEAKFEEINFVEKGNNYGWPIFEGELCLDPPCDDFGYTFPIYTYAHNQGCAVTGGLVYRGDLLPQIFGNYLFGDYCAGNIWSIVSDGNETMVEIVGTPGVGISSFGEDDKGEIYFIDYLGGEIYKVVGFNPEDSLAVSDLLSETGCFSSGDPKIPDPGLIPYDVVVPLWSDGALKKRWMAIPDNLKITIDENKQLNFPPGTIFIKQFSRNGILIETRLLLQYQDSDWAGFSYEWNEEGTEAYLVSAEGKNKILADGSTWRYPSRAQCLRCHTKISGQVLGLDLKNLYRDFLYPSTGISANQLLTWNYIGLFEDDISDKIPEITPFPNLFEDQPLDENLSDMARAYLDVNCSFCHQPGGPGIGPEDFRFETPFKDMGACDVPPTRGDLGIDGAKLIYPGSPEKSILWQRINALDDNRMPPLGTEIIHEEAVDLIGEWIDSIQDCD